MALLRAACVLLGIPALCSASLIPNLLITNPALAVASEARGAIPPQLDVPPPPEYEDVVHPEFEPYPIDDLDTELQDGALLEQFDGDADEVLNGRWRVITGEWSVEPPVQFPGFAHDQGLVLKSEQKSSAIARKLPAILDTTSGSKPLVVQYEVKTQQPLRCGGAYLKLLPPTDATNSAEVELDSDTAYVVMFGPDRCGTTDKVHLILKDRSGTEHHLQQPPRTHSGLLSSVYTLIIQPDQTFEIRRDGVTLRAGNLLDAGEFDPPLVPPREIDDPEDTKPSDWVEEKFIPDPNETEKPEDWDEDQPYLISDPEAVKPAGWHEDWPLFIPDPDAVKPDVWDDEEDGEWQAPEIMNPKCAELDLDSGEEGCGEWLAPLVRNPAFRGKWAQPLVPNPDYKGMWKPRRIANPEFDLATVKPNKLADNIGGVGFELLTVQGNILFDNLYVGHSVVDAENIGNATWSPKYYIELESQGRAADARRRQADEAARKRADGQTVASRIRTVLDEYRYEFQDFKVHPRQYVVDVYNDFLELFRVSKFTAIKMFPLTFVVFVTGAAAVTAVVFGLFNALLVLVTGKQMPQARKRDQKRLQEQKHQEQEHHNEKAHQDESIPEVRITEIKQ